MSKPKDLTKYYYTLKKCPYTNEVISSQLPGTKVPGL